MVTETKTKPMDPTGRRLFFQLLRKARIFKKIGESTIVPKSYQGLIVSTYSLGYAEALFNNREDFTIADNMRDVWKCQTSGAE